MNLFDYVKKYGDLTFEEKAFNDLDNLVFCSLSYLNYSCTSINLSKHTVEYLAREYLKMNKYFDIMRLGIPQKNGYKLLEIVKDLRRYKDIIMHNYVYNYNKNKQFSAVMFKINDKLEYICFEGTDELVSGWKEDMELACFFPIPSQKDAIRYVNKNIKVFGPNVIIGGHSKGGNLALVASMYTKGIKQLKIKKIYNNDGPGLRNNEFNSLEYKRVKKKLVHYVPHSSIVGVLLKNDVYNVIKSTSNNILSHSMMSWVIEDDKLVKDELSNNSLELEKNLIKWLENHSDIEKEKIVSSVFKTLEDAQIVSFIELGNISNIIKVINNIRNIDEETRNILVDLIKNTFQNYKFINTEKVDKIKEMINDKRKTKKHSNS